MVTSAPHYDYETAAHTQGYRLVAGIDEVGRGPLAGPVMAAAVILDPASIPRGLNDSKTLTAKKRLILFDEIMLAARAIGIGSASAVEIDAMNIRQATFCAMRRALSALNQRADFALIDGNALPPNLLCPAQTIVKGDALSLSIAAASIIAKVTRDRLMVRLSHHFPHYGFEENAGYPTEKHRMALTQFGPTPYHRMSFGPLKHLQNSEENSGKQ